MVGVRIGTNNALVVYVTLHIYVLMLVVDDHVLGRRMLGVCFALLNDYRPLARLLVRKPFLFQFQSSFY